MENGTKERKMKNKAQGIRNRQVIEADLVQHEIRESELNNTPRHVQQFIIRWHLVLNNSLRDVEVAALNKAMVACGDDWKAKADTLQKFETLVELREAHSTMQAVYARGESSAVVNHKVSLAVDKAVAFGWTIKWDRWQTAIVSVK